MKKIMFNDQYVLTAAVLTGRKTQTRRIITLPETFKGQKINGFKVLERGKDRDYQNGFLCMCDEHGNMIESAFILPKYSVSEKVAIAQRYKDVISDYHNMRDFYVSKPGWDNKMFVKADLMPNHIRITNVRIERLQEISDDDCIAEGLLKEYGGYGFTGYDKKSQKTYYFYSTDAKNAFASLIDHTCGKGTWDKNPLVWVYSFNLIELLNHG